MDPTKHHNDLENDQVRNLIADGLRNHDVSTGFYAVDNYRGLLVEALEKAKKKLDDFDQGRALKMITSAFNFDTFGPEDSSNWDREMYNPQTYRLFVGTKEEFDRVYNPSNPAKYTYEMLESMTLEQLQEIAQESGYAPPGAGKGQLALCIMYRQEARRERPL